MDTVRLLLLALLFCSAAAVAQVYRWVDEDGVVHYSDRAQPGAEEVVLVESNRSRALAPRAARSPSPTRDTADDAQQTSNPYQSLSIASPSSEQTLWNIGGVLNVSLSVSPALRPGHQVRVYFDGQQQNVSGTRFQIREVYRGEHNLQAEILDASGNLMIRSEPTRFYVQQNSVITPP